jgi:hypothetical protein
MVSLGMHVMVAQCIQVNVLIRRTNMRGVASIERPAVEQEGATGTRKGRWGSLIAWHVY